MQMNCGVNKMNAQEMFEELGYTKKEDNNLILSYNKTQGSYRLNCLVEMEIFFHKLDCTFTKRQYNDVKHGYLNVKEHKAINKQMEELGWI